MQFEQLNTYDQRFDSFPSLHYPTLDNDGKVYCKIDWLTVMFFDCSMNHVLKWLHMDNCITDFCSSAYQQSRGYDEVFKFMYNNIMLETSSFNFYGQDVDVSIFDVIVPKIRLELSGSALDYLRSTGIDMNEYRLVKPILPDGGTYHFTRCDFAYDFINYKPEFVDRMIEHINIHKLPSERIPLASTKGAISCKVVTGGQKTIYLGSPQSDRMLRVYDKKMQYVDLGTGVYKKDNPYGNPDSWFRIEWQTRNKFANNLVHGVDDNGVPADFKSILKDIFDRYAFADGTVKRDRNCVEFWLDLFNWEDLERRIVQNAKYVEFSTPEERCINTFKLSMIRNFIYVYSLLGKKGIEELCNLYLRSLDNGDPVSNRRRLAFLNRLNEFSNYNVPTDTSSEGLVNICGRLFFKM